MADASQTNEAPETVNFIDLSMPEQIEIVNQHLFDQTAAHVYRKGLRGRITRVLLNKIEKLQAPKKLKADGTESKWVGRYKKMLSKNTGGVLNETTLTVAQTEKALRQEQKYAATWQKEEDRLLKRGHIFNRGDDNTVNVHLADSVKKQQALYSSIHTQLDGIAFDQVEEFHNYLAGQSAEAPEQQQEENDADPHARYKPKSVEEATPQAVVETAAQEETPKEETAPAETEMTAKEPASVKVETASVQEQLGTDTPFTLLLNRTNARRVTGATVDPMSLDELTEFAARVIAMPTEERQTLRDLYDNSDISELEFEKLDPTEQTTYDLKRSNRLAHQTLIDNAETIDQARTQALGLLSERLSGDDPVYNPKLTNFMIDCMRAEQAGIKDVGIIPQLLCNIIQEEHEASVPENTISNATRRYQQAQEDAFAKEMAAYEKELVEFANAEEAKHLNEIDLTSDVITQPIELSLEPVSIVDKHAAKFSKPKPVAHLLNPNIKAADIKSYIYNVPAQLLLDELAALPDYQVPAQPVAETPVQQAAAEEVKAETMSAETEQPMPATIEAPVVETATDQAPDQAPEAVVSRSTKPVVIMPKAKSVVRAHQENASEVVGPLTHVHVIMPEMQLPEVEAAAVSETDVPETENENIIQENGADGIVPHLGKPVELLPKQEAPVIAMKTEESAIIAAAKQSVDIPGFTDNKNSVVQWSNTTISDPYHARRSVTYHYVAK